MSVVINEFEVVPAPPEQAPAREPVAAEPRPPGLAAQLEVERAVATRRERDLRLRAD